jgi:hypothetical protein
MTANEYRSNAEDCLRMAKTAPEDGDRPLWVTMAQSWLRLAEHADRMRRGLAADDTAGHGEPEAAQATSAPH